MVLFISVVPGFAQNQQSANDIVLKMQHDLNLSEDQVAGVTQIVERYVDASNDLEKSVSDGTINQSAIDSQKQQIKAVEEQGIEQYLRSDQVSQWRMIESQEGDKGGSGGDADEYSNLPKNTSAQN